MRTGACLALLLCSFAAIAADGPTTRTIEAEGASVRVDFQSTNLKHGVAPIVTWIRRSMAHRGALLRPVSRQAAAHPGDRARNGNRVRHGTTYGTSVPFIRLQLGRDVTADELRNDWVLVHEMVHLALPEVGDDHLWFTEGLSTYIEGIARVQAGELRAERVWTEQVRSMPNGLPGPGRQRSRSHSHLGPNVLGRSAVLPAGRCRDSQEDVRTAWACAMRCAPSYDRPEEWRSTCRSIAC